MGRGLDFPRHNIHTIPMLATHEFAMHEFFSSEFFPDDQTDARQIKRVTDRPQTDVVHFLLWTQPAQQIIPTGQRCQLCEAVIGGVIRVVAHRARILNGLRNSIWCMQDLCVWLTDLQRDDTGLTESRQRVSGSSRGPEGRSGCRTVRALGCQY